MNELIAKRKQTGEAAACPADAPRRTPECREM